MAAILPGILYVAAAIVFGIGFPLNKQTLVTMMDELKQRRETGAD